MATRPKISAPLLLFLIASTVLRAEVDDGIIRPSDKPNAVQQRMIDRKYGMFVHFGINTFHDEEWTDGSKPAASFAPAAVDTDQWVRTAKAAGMKYLILTAKHHDGFCLWDSARTDYDVASSPCKTDIVAAVARSCREQGLQLGIYYSLWDRHEPCYTNPAVYVQFMVDQLTELLSNYGPICELWLDGGWERKRDDWDIPALYALVKKLQPGCAVGVNWSIGKPGDPDAHLIKPDAQKEGFPIRYFPSDFRLGDPYLPVTPDPKLFSNDGQLYYLPFESTICLNSKWFSNTGDNALKTVDELEKLYKQATSQDNILILNSPPNREGVMPERNVKRLQELAERLGLASTATPAKPKVDLTVAPVETLREQIKTTLYSTKPDYVVFVPEVTAGGVTDTGNEHFLVFDGPKKTLMVVWTQSTREGEPDQHIVFAQSKDQGKTWSKPRIIAGPAKPGDGPMASWGYPLVSKSGRIYVLYSQHVGKVDTFFHTTGQLTGIYSDDAGQTWSRPQTIEMPRTSRDNPDNSFPANCITWQKPQRLGKHGKYIVGLTRWTSKAVKKNPTPSWISHDSVVEFMRFENLDRNPEPGQLKISWLAWDKDAITVPYPGHPDVSVCQEPSIVKLPDGRLFCVMRTMAGTPYWTQSRDDGNTWSPAKPLLRRDSGEPLRHPLSPCPIFDLGGPAKASGRYALFIHNHDGNYQGFGVTDTQLHRRPVYVVIGKFQPKAEQPVWFEEPKFFMDHDGVSLGPPGKRGRLDLALYSSMTLVNGKPVLWYPERKFFLLGKRIE